MSPRTQGTIWVGLQFGLLAVLAAWCLQALGRAPPGWGSVGLWLASAGLGLWTLAANRPGNFNVRPEPKAGGQLIRHGPYRWVRHPMYGAVLLLAAGASAWVMTLGGWLLLGALLAVLLAKARLEERWLLQQHPGYADYRQRTWWLLPWVY